MKLFFLKDDSLYKIFTTLEKTQKNSHVQIFIESENQFFNNSRWFKQINWIAQKRNIETVFIAENSQQQKFFEDNNINHDIKKQSKIRKAINLLYRFFFNIKKFHLHTYQHKNYTFFAIFWSEIFLLIILGYFFYSLILPQTTITISPSYQINEIVYNFRYMYPEDIKNYPYVDKHIIIPLYKNSVKNISVSLNVNKTKIPKEHSILQWKIRLINKTNTVIWLQEKTQLIDSNGIEFVIKKKISIPKSQWFQKAGFAYADIITKDNEKNNKLIEQYWKNITMWHQLIIKKLKQSSYTKQVYAEIVDWFTQQNIQNTGFILLNEIGNLQKELYFQLFDKRKSYITQKDVPDWWVFVPFNKFISVTWCQYSAAGDNKDIKELKNFSWTLDCTIDFAYVKKQDIIAGIQQYIEKRSTDSRKIVSIQNNFINFYQILTGEYNASIIPTRVNVIESYNMKTDRNNIIPTIKSQIIGMDITNAKNSISAYPEIEKIDIKISPRRYSTITSIKSRIFINIKEQEENT
jgi:hypothetical protein